jgi:hypothetical protein
MPLGSTVGDVDKIVETGDKAFRPTSRELPFLGCVPITLQVLCKRLW